MQVFLSYAQPDASFARDLARQLEKRGLSVWSTETDVLPGDNVWLSTGKALKKSKAMVVLLSPDSVRSTNVRREIEYALGDLNYEGRLFPVQVRPTKDIPWILRSFKIFNARQSAARISESIAGALKQVA